MLPRLGQLVAGDDESYRYLAESIRMHPDQATLKAMMKSAGFGHVDVHNLSARRRRPARGDQVLIGSRRRLAARATWRAPLSLGVGLPLLFGSTPAAAAETGGLLLGGVTTWLGVLAALLALLAPSRPGDLAGAAAIVVVGALLGAICR